MKNKKVVITGAGSGLGAALAEKFATNGATVILLGRTLEKLEAVKRTLPNQAKAHALDVSDFGQVKKVFAEIGKVDILINNAGLGVFDAAESIIEEAIHQMVDINLKGTIFCTQAVLPQMKEENAGVIANVVSTAGVEGKATETAYCASKFGARGFTEALQVELQDTGIRVYGAYMGGMATNFWDGILDEDAMAGLMDPRDVAEIIFDNIKVRHNLEVREIVIKNKH